jgi:hypothetical protein
MYLIHLLSSSSLAKQQNSLPSKILPDVPSNFHFFRFHNNNFSYSKVVSLVFNPQPGGSGLSVFIVARWPRYTPGTGFPHHHLLRLAGLQWRYSNLPPHAIHFLSYYVQIQTVLLRTKSFTCVGNFETSQLQTCSFVYVPVQLL